MTFDTRERRATEAAHASAESVDPAGRLTEMKHHAGSRTRLSRAVQASAAVLVIGMVAWLVAANSPSQHPPAAPVVTPTAATPAPTQRVTGPDVVVGSAMRPSIRAVVPQGWSVDHDGEWIWLSSETTVGPALVIGPPTQVFDPRTHHGVPAPADYASWLRHHPWLDVLDDTTVVVDGRRVPQLVVRIRDGARTTGDHPASLPFTRFGGADFFVVRNPNRVFTETVLTVHGTQVVISADRGLSPLAQDLTDAGLEALLASIRT